MSSTVKIALFMYSPGPLPRLPILLTIFPSRLNFNTPLSEVKKMEFSVNMIRLIILIG